MTDDAHSDSKQGSRPSAGQWVIALFVVLALVASVLMVVGNDLSMQASLAVIAALWAAVIGAVLVTKYRRQADVAENRTRDLRLVYELQLEREIAARRQYESDVEASIRHELATESNHELEELKIQVLALRSSLEQLLGEPLPASRIAIGLERPRELGSGLAGASYAEASDDRAAAERDFATTAPPVESGRHVPSDDAPPSGMTEIIPVVTEEPEREPEPRPAPQQPPQPQQTPSGRFPQPPPVPQTPQRPQGDLRPRPEPRPQTGQQPRPQFPSGPQTGGHQRAAFGPGAYEPPSGPVRQAPGRPQPPRQAPGPQQPHPNEDGAHAAGRPASELFSRLRETPDDPDRQSGGRRRRRD
ncbi:hypothetical protein nbrc107696_04470 [Gordonia spumicola]|uniref:DUF6779 domain-containing protein n=1 Tax=Gordonia spumicola TaxID=589161 RepID=A0A7I9V4R1_9ACTN|nr:DUF6779 domain-containing protein [Gordonia spumicola]GEE00001.1 hypothetical protein nbrc107696_04470 [Gordonia spumicola]